jgi:uncharacterized protein
VTGAVPGCDGLGRLRGVGVVPGKAEGVALVSADRIGFNLGVDERSGIVVERGHPLEGQCVAGKILVFPGGKGSTASSFSLLQLASRGLAPVAMINLQCDAIIVAGAVLAGIPLVHQLDAAALAALNSGDRLRVDADAGFVEVLG